MLFKKWWWEGFCFVAWIAFIGTQLFVRPITGLADNGDFPKVLGPLNVCDPDGRRDVFAYVFPRYMIDPGCAYDPKIPSSESIFSSAVTFYTEWHRKRIFSITEAGVAHLAAMLVSMVLLLWAVHDAAAAIRFGLLPLIVFVFSDTAYVAQLNSFYMDTASMLFLFPTVVAAIIAVVKPRSWVPLLYGAAGVLLTTSKAQRIPLGLLVALLGIWLGFRQRKQRTLWAGSTIAILAAAAAMAARTPPDYSSIPIYNMVFYKLTKEAANPVLALKELGLPSSDAIAVGTYSYSPGNKYLDWRYDLLRQTSFGRIGLYYFHHPRVPWSLLIGGLNQDAQWIRAVNLGNREKQDGFPPRALAHGFDHWTNGRSWLIRKAPWHLPILYILSFSGSLVCLFSPWLAARWPLYPVGLFLTLAGVTEYCFSLLADCLENARHLSIFHVITELVILFLFAGASSLFRIKPTAGKEETSPPGRRSASGIT